MTPEKLLEKIPTPYRELARRFARIKCEEQRTLCANTFPKKTEAANMVRTIINEAPLPKL